MTTNERARPKRDPADLIVSDEDEMRESYKRDVERSLSCEDYELSDEAYEDNFLLDYEQYRERHLRLRAHYLAKKIWRLNYYECLDAIEALHRDPEVRRLAKELSALLFGGKEGMWRYYDHYLPDVSAAASAIPMATSTATVA
jgi:hypothetical protein